MPHAGRLDRRKFMVRAAALLAGARASTASEAAAAQARALVVRVSSARASRPWDYDRSAPWDHTVEPRSVEDMRSGRFRPDRYIDAIDHAVVRGLLDAGLARLTGTTTARDAWRQLLPAYRDGHRITVKVNFNNASFDERVTTNRMDQSPAAINAVAGSLVTALGAPQESITIADPSRWIDPVAVRRCCPYPGLAWVDSKSANLWDPTESVAFSRDQPARPQDRPDLPEKVPFHIARTYTQADHIINLCLLKNHGCGVTGAMKNHFGAIPPPAAKYLHTGLGSRSYIADLCNTASIRNKVRVNICEAIFGNWHDNVWCPRPWRTFPGGTPNSLFLGTDPVAFDSVLLHHIGREVRARGLAVDEWVRQAVADHEFLQYAMDHHGLGVHEHEPFSRIDYREISIGTE